MLTMIAKLLIFNGRVDILPKMIKQALVTDLGRMVGHLLAGANHLAVRGDGCMCTDRFDII